MKSPLLSVPVRRWDGQNGGRQPRCASEEQDLVAVEEPLEIRMGARDIAVIMRTPGNDAELAAGFLFTEGVLGAAQVSAVDCARNSVTVTPAGAVEFDDTLRRSFYVNSSCGVCGRSSIDALEASGCTMLDPGPASVSEEVIRSLPAKLRRAQRVFERTGGLHACGLFDAEGTVQLVREDIGRHNAVDKIVGRALLDGALPLSGRVLVVSGRASFELVQKAVMAGVPILAAVGAPSSLAVKTALRFRMTLIGFLREDRFNVYTCPWRLSA